jgi:hypothetical protein
MITALEHVDVHTPSFTVPFVLNRFTAIYCSAANNNGTDKRLQNVKKLNII